MWSLCGFLHGIKWIMFQGHLDYFHKTPLGGRPNTKTRRPWHSERSHLLIYYILSCMKTLLEYKFIKPTFGWGLGHIWLHTTLEGPWPQYTILQVSRPPLGGRPNTKLGDHGTLNAHNCRSIIFYYAWGPTWIKIHQINIWLRAWSHMTSRYPWGPGTTLHDFGHVLATAFGHFFWALTTSWSWLLARVLSGLKYNI